MNNFKTRTFRALAAAAFLAVVCSAAYAQQVQRAPFDITHYKMDVSIQPDLNRLEAVVDVDLVPKAETRVITFEMNGSLVIDSIERVAEGSAEKAPKAKQANAAAPQSGVTFVQDRVGVSDLGPSVRVDLGSMVSSGAPLKLRFKYGGVMVTPEGGPLLTKRLAFIGPNDGYLMYAARWFPFHDYAADKATSDITIALPPTFQVVGHSDLPALPLQGKTRFVRNEPGLVGNFTYGRYATKNLKYGPFELNFYTKQGVEPLVELYGETLGKALEYYSRRWGTPSMGGKLIVVQIDDESPE
ncbi:MAG: hypothetical protein J5I65_00015 [Aridibacter famidurans]|nr:hypothetical protein [Aridibacter famidurans]